MKSWNLLVTDENLYTLPRRHKQLDDTLFAELFKWFTVGFFSASLSSLCRLYSYYYYFAIFPRSVFVFAMFLLCIVYYYLISPRFCVIQIFSSFRQPCTCTAINTIYPPNPSIISCTGVNFVEGSKIRYSQLEQPFLRTPNLVRTSTKIQTRLLQV